MLEADRTAPKSRPPPGPKRAASPKIVFKPDFARHRKAAPFKRNDMMVAAGLTGVVLFPGNGITPNLGQKADQAGVRVTRCGGGRSAVALHRCCLTCSLRVFGIC